MSGNCRHKGYFLRFPRFKAIHGFWLSPRCYSEIIPLWSRRMVFQTSRSELWIVFLWAIDFMPKYRPHDWCRTVSYLREIDSGNLITVKGNLASSWNSSVGKTLFTVSVLRKCGKSASREATLDCRNNYLFRSLATLPLRRNYSSKKHYLFPAG